MQIFWKGLICIENPGNYQMRKKKRKITLNCSDRNIKENNQITAWKYPYSICPNLCRSLQFTHVIILYINRECSWPLDCREQWLVVFMLVWWIWRGWCPIIGGSPSKFTSEITEESSNIGRKQILWNWFTLQWTESSSTVKESLQKGSILIWNFP